VSTQAKVIPIRGRRREGVWVTRGSTVIYRIRHLALWVSDDYGEVLLATGREELDEAIRILQSAREKMK
jgi:hypothetical protein